MRWAALCAASAWAARVVDVTVDGDGETDDGGPLSSWANAITSLCRRPIQLSSHHHATVRYWDPTLQRYQARTVVLPKFEGDEGTEP